MLKTIIQAMVGPMCQSCGMPLKQDPAGGGSEQDGTISKTYCSLCYKDGAFLNPEMSLSQMLELVSHKMTELKMPGVVAKLMTNIIPSLGRWQAAKA